MVKECVDSYNESYYDYAISIPLCFVLHIVLFIHSLRNLSALKQRQVNCKVPLLFIVMQIIALLWNANEFIRHCISSRYYVSWFYDSSFYCYYAAMSSRALIPIFYTLLLNLLLIKLRISFKTSFHPLSNTCFYLLSIILYSSIIMLILALFVFGKIVCVSKVFYFDLKQNVHKCVHIMDGISLYTSYYGLGLIVGFNGILGYIFISKLHIVSQNKRSDQDIYSVMIKNTILTLTLCTSSLISWLLWFLSWNLPLMNGFGGCFIHLDVFFNCLMIELMYFYNERWYNLLCSTIGCIQCFHNCYVVKNGVISDNVTSGNSTPDQIIVVNPQQRTSTDSAYLHTLHLQYNSTQSTLIELQTPQPQSDIDSPLPQLPSSLEPIVVHTSSNYVE